MRSLTKQMVDQVQAMVVRQIEDEVQRFARGRRFSGQFSSGDRWYLTITNIDFSISLDIEWDEEYWEYEL
jgi:hypothetical protein